MTSYLAGVSIALVGWESKMACSETSGYPRDWTGVGQRHAKPLPRDLDRKGFTEAGYARLPGDAHELNPAGSVRSHLNRSLDGLAKRDISPLTALVKTRLRRMQYQRDYPDRGSSLGAC
jgi:hypothetical protein